MRRLLQMAAVFALLSLSVGVVNANVFNLGPGLTSLETVVIGDPGNAGQMSGGQPGYPPAITTGSVSYAYQIGKYEVTAAQYVDFLNAKAKTDPFGLYHVHMSASNGCGIQRSGSSGSYSYSVSADWANRPVNWVSYWDACRFANWLNNGQGDGDTETGAYTLNGYNGSDGREIQRNDGAYWFIPNEDEWYKAAYYKGGGTNSGYWLYPTGSDTAPSNKLMNPDSGNSANYNYSIGAPYYLTNVGEYENSSSAYGTFDQGGNVNEWNERTLLSGSIAYRGARGGTYFDGGFSDLSASYMKAYIPTFEAYTGGFRVAGVVPEPSSLSVLLTGGFGVLWGWRKRRSRL